RYAVQPPFEALNGSYSTATLQSLWGKSGYKAGCDLSNANPTNCNLFHPGGIADPNFVPSYINFGAGVKAYNTDWNNWAPSIGVNWTPTPRDGFMQKIFGAQQGDTALLAGWSRAYERHGMSDFTGVFQGNPGININANRNAANGNILLGGAAPPL